LPRNAWRIGTVNLRQNFNSSFASFVSGVSIRRSPQRGNDSNSDNSARIGLMRSSLGSASNSAATANI
ncbi:hypothetical protein D049_4128B, partial [Vibrio parahaemolyticus VPTS-2010]